MTARLTVFPDNDDLITARFKFLNGHRFTLSNAQATDSSLVRFKPSVAYA
jgi:hypothetical protein